MLETNRVTIANLRAGKRVEIFNGKIVISKLGGEEFGMGDLQSKLYKNMSDFILKNFILKSSYLVLE